MPGSWNFQLNSFLIVINNLLNLYSGTGHWKTTHGTFKKYLALCFSSHEKNALQVFVVTDKT